MELRTLLRSVKTNIATVHVGTLEVVPLDEN